ncbi:MAG: lysophospholipid acyltransferase family protein [Desulfocapsaceae bacterium]|nr:lysophospholipid acyltransferase family protein [Desulfocapsaceae bacterium]
MKQLDIQTTYLTTPQRASFLTRLVPSIRFYCRFIAIVIRASRLARRGIYNDQEWITSSFNVFRQLERIGVCFHISGIEHLRDLEGPCVIIGNHMSLMESVVLPVIIGPIKAITFIVKESLLTYPVFRHIMRSRNPIAVTRINPKHDLQTVMKEGVDRLQRGISVIVFPQTTRSPSFDPEQMSSIGVKLAKKAGVPIIPLALRTSSWKNGKIIKDFGKIDVSEVVRFSFGESLRVQGKGGEEHQKVTEFIEGKLKEWETG